jgi:Methyltransferase domain
MPWASGRSVFLMSSGTVASESVALRLPERVALVGSDEGRGAYPGRSRIPRALRSVPSWVDRPPPVRRRLEANGPVTSDCCYYAPMLRTQALARRVVHGLETATRWARSLADAGVPVTPTPPPPPSSPPPSPEHPALRFAPPGHFYSPIPDLDDLRQRAGQIFARRVTEIPGLDLREREQLALLKRFRGFYRDQPFDAHKTAERRYYFENPQYSYSDALFYHFILRYLRPRAVIEVGSGFSSCVALDTNETHLDGQLRLTCIEPYPDRLRALMKPPDEERVEVVPKPVQDVPLTTFDALRENDILFIDSTHVVKVGGDVNYLFFEVLPRLAKGVHVHVHDVFYPFEYPLPWLEEGRVWSEAYLLRAFLQYNSAFEVVAFNTFLEERHPRLFERDFPLCLRNPGGSIWLRRL